MKFATKIAITVYVTLKVKKAIEKKASTPQDRKHVRSYEDISEVGAMYFRIKVNRLMDKFEGNSHRPQDIVTYSRGNDYTNYRGHPSRIRYPSTTPTRPTSDSKD